MQKGNVWIPIPHGLGTSDPCCFIRLLNSFGTAWFVYHGNGSLGSGELVGMHIENGLPPCELEDLQIKAFYSVYCVRAYMCVRGSGRVGGLVENTRCLDKPCELLALLGGWPSV